PDWVHTGDPVLDAVNVQTALGEFDLVPLQVADLRGPQTVAIGHQGHGRIAMAVAAMLAGAVHQALDLALGEIASFDCQAYDVWCAFPGCRFHADKPYLRVSYCICYTLFLHSRKGKSGRMHRDCNQDGGTGAGAQHSDAGREANLIFVLPPNLCMGPPGGGDFLVSNFHPGPALEIWSETISGCEEVLAGKWGGLFLGYLLGKNFWRRDRDRLVPPGRTDAAVCRAEVC